MLFVIGFLFFHLLSGVLDTPFEFEVRICANQLMYQITLQWTFWQMRWNLDIYIYIYTSNGCAPRLWSIILYDSRVIDIDGANKCVTPQPKKISCSLYFVLLPVRHSIFQYYSQNHTAVISAWNFMPWKTKLNANFQQFFFWWIKYR